MATKQRSTAAAIAPIASDQTKLLMDRIAVLEQQVQNMRQRAARQIPERNEDDFLGIDIGTFGIAWARLNYGELDDFGTLQLREHGSRDTLGDARNFLRTAIPDLLTRWMDSGRPTVTAIEEPVSNRFSTSKGLGMFKVMIEEALFTYDALVLNVRPNQWHGMVRSNATSEQMTQARVIRKGKAVTDIKALGALLAHECTPTSPARQQGGTKPIAMQQDECDAYWIARFARLAWAAEAH